MHQLLLALLTDLSSYNHWCRASIYLVHPIYFELARHEKFMERALFKRRRNNDNKKQYLTS